MPNETLEVDYVIKGAGATSMAFADTLLSESDATMAIVDLRDRPGGHWNDAYPFVRLHQPSSSYGVNSRPLGTGAKDEVGLNKGFYELASGQEVLSHFDLAMNERFLPSGRVRFFPMSRLDDDGTVTSLLSGARTVIKARKFVDGTHSQMRIPSTHKPTFSVAPEVTFVPVNDLPRRAAAHSEFVIVGAGKTAMDAVTWLLQNGAPPERIRWIMPRDFWLMNRANFQPGAEFFERVANDLANQVEALANATNVDELFLDLERRGHLQRIDPSVKPEGYHCAVVSERELEELRRVKNIVRLGHVTAIEPDRIVLEQGTIPTSPAVLHVDCSATGIPRLPGKPIFEGNRITLQFVRFCQPVFSAAMIAHVEATFDNEADKNRVCAPQAIPNTPADYVETMRTELRNRIAANDFPELGEWRANTRLDQFETQIRTMPQTCPEALPHFQRYVMSLGAAMRNIEVLLAK